MRAKWLALGISALCAVYLVVAGIRAWTLLSSGEWQGVLLGLGVLLVPLLVGGAVAARAEVRSGHRVDGA